MLSVDPNNKETVVNFFKDQRTPEGKSKIFPRRRNRFNSCVSGAICLKPTFLFNQHSST